MSGNEAAMAIAALAGFLGVITFGVLVIASVASKREDHRFSLDGAAPDLVTRIGRILMRVGTSGNRVWGR